MQKNSVEIVRKHFYSPIIRGFILDKKDYFDIYIKKKLAFHINFLLYQGYATLRKGAKCMFLVDKVILIGCT